MHAHKTKPKSWDPPFLLHQSELRTATTAVVAIQINDQDF